MKTWFVLSASLDGAIQCYDLKRAMRVAEERAMAVPGYAFHVAESRVQYLGKEIPRRIEVTVTKSDADAAPAEHEKAEPEWRVGDVILTDYGTVAEIESITQATIRAHIIGQAGAISISKCVIQCLLHREPSK